ncbi:MAG: helix-turn-helix transcriptional regulator [Rhodobacteraceae bacterium]|nr:helix-turn-helix transcriptional regulator [Paracoccaceae bacterium]
MSLDAVFAALAHPVRRGMVERLTRAPATVGDLAAPLTMSLPSVVQHLKILEDSGLVRSAKTGRVRTCYLETRGLTGLQHWLAAQRAEWEARTDRLEEFLLDKDDTDDGRST